MGQHANRRTTATPAVGPGIGWEVSTPGQKQLQPQSASGAYYVITGLEARDLPEGHTRAKSLEGMVSALGLEPRTL
jgi:hypothetical protein